MLQTSQGHRTFSFANMPCAFTPHILHGANSSHHFAWISHFNRMVIDMRCHSALIDSRLLARIRSLSTTPRDIAVSFAYCVAVPFTGKVFHLSETLMFSVLLL